ncbi:acyl-CoA N-acyltransferase [Achaetomium macrosporum]|uniref:Acyl-CoA N-acyltransferase n=1 Tax=Achaetomium macrosporum TaxID=79813 RepID=A0AAN7HAL3_9PEZI|nr:acyl-CoA N-acyltransferase [Achaetomium macrosporum]
MTINTNNIHFRVATPEDAPRIYRLVQSAYRGEESKQCWTTARDLLSGDRIDIAGIIAKINDPDSVILLATDIDTLGADLVGCCEVTRGTSQLAYFGLLAVSPCRQGGGIGKQVLAYAEDYSRRIWGVRRLELTVVWIRTELIQWYMRRGYRKIGETPFPHEELENIKGAALRQNLYLDVMAKDLGGSSSVAGEETPSKAEM